MSLKTKTARKILDPIVIHLNKFKEILCDNNDDDDDVNNTDNISMNKNTIIQHFHRLISIMFDEFLHYSNDNIDNILAIKSNIIDNFNKLFSTMFNDPIVMEKFIDEFTCALIIHEKYQCIEIKRKIDELKFYMDKMSKSEVIECILNVKELALKLMELFQLLLSYGKNLISQLLKEKIILYIHQLYVSFDMLINLINEQHKLNILIINTRKYLYNRLFICLDKINIDILDCLNPTDDEELYDKSNHFVYKMDCALDLLGELMGNNQDDEINKCNELWPAIENVFSYAMSIAQVCQPVNFQSITNICNIIITEYENLKEQLSSIPREISMNSLFIKTTTDALYKLEREINISVLTLVKDVFSDPFCILAKIIDMCGSSLSPDKRNRSDIASDFENFDKMYDEIMQIGYYAMACCRDINRVAKIRNIMASIESIELELIPTITMFYLNPQNEQLRSSAKLLTDQWQKDIREFRTVIQMIIDPAAYCQIVLDDLEERIRIMNYNLDNHIAIQSYDIKTFVLRGCTLAMQITYTIDDIGIDKIDKQTIMMIRELKAAVYEASAAEKRLRTITITDPEQLRVIKRCELLLNVIRRLQPVLVTVINNWELECSNEELTQLSYNSSLSNSTSMKIKTPYTVKTFKHSISIKTPDIEPKTPLQQSCLIQYIKQGHTMRIERSIMYRNPPLSSSLSSLNISRNINNRNLSCVRQHLFSRDSSIISQSREIDLNNVSYDLTCILSELSLDNSNISHDINDDINSLVIGNDNEQSTVIIDTPQRISDIQQLNKKIDILQKYNNNTTK